MQVPGHRAGPGTKLPRPRRPSPAEASAPLPPEARDEIACRGHAFDEDLNCSCGVTWWEHQRRPRSCRLHAQRCHRTGEPPLEPPAAVAGPVAEPASE